MVQYETASDPLTGTTSQSSMQLVSSMLPAAEIDITYNNNFSGFELIKMADDKVFIIAEDVHNRRLAPAMTLKFVQFLYHHP